MTGRRRFLLAVFLAALAAATAQGRADAPPATAAPAEGKEKDQVATLTIFNTGDLHERTGNLVRIAGYVKARKAEDPNVLLIDAGDFLDDGNLGDGAIKSTGGEAMLSLMTAAGYDACILGNHDRKFGKDRILELCNQHPKFPMVLCNVKWDEKDREQAKVIPRYKVFELKGVRVAVIGSISGLSNHEHGPAFPAFHEREGYTEVLPEARKKADVIVFISHRWEGSDTRLLDAWGDNAPDVLIGAHSHQTFVRRVGKTLWIKAGALGNQLGRVTIQWDGEKVVSTEGKVLNVGKDWPEDETVKALRESYMSPKKSEAPKDQKTAPAPPEPEAAPALNAGSGPLASPGARQAA